MVPAGVLAVAVRPVPLLLRERSSCERDEASGLLVVQGPRPPLASRPAHLELLRWCAVGRPVLTLDTMKRPTPCQVAECGALSVVELLAADLGDHGEVGLHFRDRQRGAARRAGQ